MVEAIKALVRPIVTFVFAGGVVYGFIEGKVDPKEFLLIAGIIFTFWFVTRDTKDTKKIDQRIEALEKKITSFIEAQTAKNA